MTIHRGVRRWALKAAATCLLVPMLAPAPVLADELKVLRVARTSQFDTLDPPRQWDGSSIELISLVYSGLVRDAYLERPYKVEPDLLEAMPDVSADGLTYTLRLRKGVRFHDDACFPGGQGRELNADDVIYSLRRGADGRVNTKSWAPSLIVGLDAFRAATMKPGMTAEALSAFPVEGLKKIDAHTLAIRLIHPNPRFIDGWTVVGLAIVPMEAVNAYGSAFGTHPVGTGPFMLKNVDRKGVLRFKRYPRYHGVYPSVGAPGDAERGLLKAAGRPLPLIDVLEMPLIEESQPRMLQFLKGELDWTGLDRANFSKLAQRQKDGGFGLQADIASRFDLYAAADGTRTVILNMKDPLLGGNKALRQALAYLVDTQAHIDLLLNGRGRKLQSLVPLDTPGSERDTGSTTYGYDLARARQLLAEAGYPGGKGLPELTVHSGGTSVEGRNEVDLMRAKAAAAGVRLKGQFVDWPTLLKSAQGGNFQLMLMGWGGGGPPDAAGAFNNLTSESLPPGPNFGSFVNADFERAYQAARWMADGPERLALLRKMNDIVREEVPVIPRYEPISVGLTQKWVHNFKRNPSVPEAIYVDVDMALKKKGLP